MASPSQSPTRLPAGSTTDPPYGPMAESGMGNPFFYHQFSDDFDNALGSAGLWTVSGAGGGTIAHTPGDGGLALFTTGNVATNFESMQLPAASFVLPQGSLAGKKMFFITRLQLSDVTNSAFIAGLSNTSATPFTALTDGVYFSKASGGTVLNLLTVSASTVLTWAIPTAAYALANATNIDLGFYIDRYQNINVFVGSQLVGFIPQSGTGAVNAATGVSLLPVVGRALQIVGPGQVAGGAQVGPWTVSSANLNVLFGVQTSAAAAKTMTVDFVTVQKER